MRQKKWRCRLLLGFFGFMLLFGLLSLTAPATAFAGEPEPAALTIKGDGVTAEKTFTLTELKAMEQYQHVYSAINTWPTKKWYVGKGVKLSGLLNEAGLKEEAALLTFTSRDGFKVTLTVQEAMYDQRYYFPGLKDNHEFFGYIPGSHAGAQEVEPILALAGAEGTDDPAAMNDANALLLMLGQRAVTEQTGSLFVQNVVEIEALTKEPEKWDKPQAEPGGGEVAAGTSVALANAHMDDDKIYYTTDGSTPTVLSPMYNWIASRWWPSRSDELDSINHPIEITRDTIIKAITIGPGKYNSDIVTFSYQVQVIAPPLLTADVTDNQIGCAIQLGFADDPAWRAAITGVSVDGAPLAADDYILEDSKLTVKAGVFTEAGDYVIAVQATGYADTIVTQTLVAGLQAPPELTADATNNVPGQLVELTFMEDPAWREAISGVSVDGVRLNAGEYMIDTGMITIDADVFYTAGDYAIAVQAAGYTDACVTQTIKPGSGGDAPVPGEDVALTITGNGVTTTKTFTLAQLKAMEQHQQVYSAINTWPTKKWYIGEGVQLKDLLESAGLKGSAKQIRFTSRDSFTVTLTVEELLKDKRYYFPKLKDNDPNLGYVSGSSSGAKQVEPILALESADGTDEAHYMNDTDSLLLMLGQRAVTEQTAQLFVKNIEEIEVLTSEPGEWDEPEAEPSGGNVAEGALVRLSSKNNDDDKVYYTTDGSTPTLNSPMYNWISSRWWSSREDDLDSVNQPVEITRDTTIKAITIGPGKENSDVVTFSYKVTEEASTGKISTNTGGTVSFGSEVSIEIPAGALTEDDLEVGIQKVAAPPAAPAGYKLLSSVYEFSVDGKKSYSFAKSVTIKLRCDAGAVSAGDTPAIFYYDEGLEQWVAIGGEASGNTVTVRVDHFTKFALMAPFREEEKTLSDITGHWAFANINKLLAMGCISGYPDKTFRPDEPITRAEFVTVLAKAFGLAPEEGKSFADTAGHWAEGYIRTLTATGIVSGYDEDTFGPDDLITREQMAVMIVKAANIAPFAGEPRFADSGSISGWAKSAVNAATMNKIMKGYEDNTIRPQDSATRAESVTAVINALSLAAQ